jgi:hypothetical protein
MMSVEYEGGQAVCQHPDYSRYDEKYETGCGYQSYQYSSSDEAEIVAVAEADLEGIGGQIAVTVGAKL